LGLCIRTTAEVKETGQESPPFSFDVSRRRQANLPVLEICHRGDDLKMEPNGAGNLIQYALSESEADHDAIKQFERWFADAIAAGVPETEAMTIATATSDGRPDARIVLLKSFDEHGFVFYTNYRSRKAKELAENAQACLLFYWLPLKRQVRIEGTVEKVTAEESEAYFQTRPLGSKLGAWASEQSEVIASRKALETRYAELALKFGENVPCPPHWGGYRIKPTAIEFWQGRDNRLHDRLNYRLQDDGSWCIERLAP
jgi:pyridoxamine 5'-phosphate oxidase